MVSKPDLDLLTIAPKTDSNNSKAEIYWTVQKFFCIVNVERLKAGGIYSFEIT